MVCSVPPDLVWNVKHWFKVSRYPSPQSPSVLILIFCFFHTTLNINILMVQQGICCHNFLTNLCNFILFVPPWVKHDLTISVWNQWRNPPLFSTVWTWSYAAGMVHISKLDFSFSWTDFELHVLKRLFFLFQSC